MAALTPDWRKSSHSIDNGNANCVEAGTAPGTVLVRDTTDRAGVTLTVPDAAWATFLGALR